MCHVYILLCVVVCNTILGFFTSVRLSVFFEGGQLCCSETLIVHVTYSPTANLRTKSRRKLKVGTVLIDDIRFFGTPLTPANVYCSFITDLRTRILFHFKLKNLGYLFQKAFSP